jgi:hypothetical protein
LREILVFLRADLIAEALIRLRFAQVEAAHVYALLRPRIFRRRDVSEATALVSALHVVFRKGCSFVIFFETGRAVALLPENQILKSLVFSL